MELFAYLDPGTGSLFIQVLIGGMLAGVVMIRSYFRVFLEKAKAIFVRQPQQKTAIEDEA